MLENVLIDFKKTYPLINLPEIPESPSFYHVYRDIESRFRPHLLVTKIKEIDAIRSETDNPSKMTGLYRRTSEKILANFTPDKHSNSKFSLCIPRMLVAEISKAFDREYSKGFFKNSALKQEKLKKRVIFLMSIIYYHSMNEYQGKNGRKNLERREEKKTVLKEGEIFVSQSVLRNIVSGKEGTEILSFLQARQFIDITKNHSYHWNRNYSYANHPKVVRVVDFVDTVISKREFTPFDDKEFCDLCWRINNSAYLKKDDKFTYKITIMTQNIVDDFKTIEQDWASKKAKKIQKIWLDLIPREVKRVIEGKVELKDSKKVQESDLKKAEKLFSKAVEEYNKRTENQLKLLKENVIDLVNGKRKIKRDEFGQRIHTNVTALKKLFRKRLVSTETENTFQGKYEEIDIASSNIAFLQRDVYAQAKEQNPFKAEIIQIERDKMGLWLRQGSFYENLTLEVREQLNDKNKVLDRKNLKTSIITYLNVENKNRNGYSINEDPEIGAALIKAIEKQFPILDAFITKFKKENHKRISSSYQRNESRLIQDIVSLLKTRKIKVVTIHDAIMVPRAQLEVAQFYVTNLMRVHGLQSIGKVKEEAWIGIDRKMFVEKQDSIAEVLSVRRKVVSGMDFKRLNTIKENKKQVVYGFAYATPTSYETVLDFDLFLNESERLVYRTRKDMEMFEDLDLIKHEVREEYHTPEFTYINRVFNKLNKMISGLNHVERFTARLMFKEMFSARKRCVDGQVDPFSNKTLPREVVEFLETELNSCHCKSLHFVEVDYFNGEDSKFFHSTLISAEMSKLFRKYLRASTAIHNLESIASSKMSPPQIDPPFDPADYPS